MRQRTFTVISDVSAAPVEPVPPMTSRQVKKRFKEANSGPRMSRAEQRREERAHQEEIRREEEKRQAETLRQRSKKRSQQARQKTKAEARYRMERTRAQRKANGLPPEPTSPSQRTLSSFLPRNALPVSGGQGRSNAIHGQGQEALEQRVVSVSAVQEAASDDLWCGAITSDSDLDARGRPPAPDFSARSTGHTAPHRPSSPPGPSIITTGADGPAHPFLADPHRQRVHRDVPEAALPSSSLSELEVLIPAALGQKPPSPPSDKALQEPGLPGSSQPPRPRSLSTWTDDYFGDLADSDFPPSSQLGLPSRKEEPPSDTGGQRKGIRGRDGVDEDGGAVPPSSPASSLPTLSQLIKAALVSSVNQHLDLDVANEFPTTSQLQWELHMEEGFGNFDRLPFAATTRPSGTKPVKATSPLRSPTRDSSDLPDMSWPLTIKPYRHWPPPTLPPTDASSTREDTPCPDRQPRGAGPDHIAADSSPVVIPCTFTPPRSTSSP